MKILITCSGTGSRLGHLTENLNKALITVGSKPALTHILEGYGKEYEFVITLGYKGDLIREYISLAHSDYNITFVEVDKFEGEGSSLVYSILCAKDELQEPFVFHACDTLGDYKVDLTANVLYYAKTDDTAQYRTVQRDRNRLSKILDKGEMDNDEAFIGVFTVKDYEAFWNASQLALQSSVCPSDADVINLMPSKFLCHKWETWYDIGNPKSLSTARKAALSEHILLDKPGLATYVLDDIVIKFFADARLVEKKVERANNMVGFTPEILGVTKHFFAYKKIDGTTARESITKEEFKNILKLFQAHLWWEKIGDPTDFEQLCRKFYVEKTLLRVKNYQLDNGVTDISEKINGTSVPSLKTLLAAVDWNVMCQDFVATKSFHGDLHFENILISKDGGIGLIDWREDFAGSDYGDVYYDLAKLYHGIIVQHNQVALNNFEITDNSFDILRSHRISECESVLFDFCKEFGYNEYKVKILTALIFLNICPLHHHPYNNFLYTLGKKMLFDLI